MVAEVLAGLSGIKTLFDIAKGLKDASTAAAINSAAIELQEKILAAQAAQTTLTKQVGELEKEVTGLKAWDAEKQEYKLTAVADGVFAFAKKPGVQGAEPPHFLCANCFNDGQKSYLQKQFTQVGRWTQMLCTRCDAVLWPDGGAPESPQRKPKPPSPRYSPFRR